MSVWDGLLSYGTLVVLIGTALLGASGGLVGCFAVLRRRSLTGDALAHAALPGVCLGYLVANERVVVLMLAGALVTGLLGTQIISLLRRYTRIKEDASIGIVLSVFFGIGAVLIDYVQKRPGGGNSSGLETYVLGQAAGMLTRDVYYIAGGALACLLVLLLLYKEFKLVSFDVGYARAQGWPTLRLDLILMALIAVTVVVGLPTVGAVMIAALLIIPPATARFWTDRLSTMLFLAAVFGAVMGFVGTAVSSVNPMPTGPFIVLVGSVMFILSLLISPKRGFVARLLARLRFNHELKQKGLLHALYDLNEPELPGRRRVPMAEIRRRGSWSERHLRPLIRTAIHDDHLLEISGDHVQLTERGLLRAAEVARAQRLWELFVNEHAELASSVVNWASDRPEDVLPEDLVAELSLRLAQDGRLPVTTNGDAEAAP